MPGQHLQLAPKIIRPYGDLRQGLTQEQLARLPGVKRPSGKNLAKRLAQVLKTDDQVFL